MNVPKINIISQRLINYSLYISHIALTKSLPGETYSTSLNKQNHTKRIISKRIEIHNSSNKSVQCGFNDDIDDENILIPTTFIQKNEGIHDCTFILLTIDNFIPNLDGDEIYKSPASDLVAINIYNELDTDIIPKDFETNTCDPYLITIEATDKSILTNNGKFEYSLQDTTNSIFPGCRFWNETISKWDDNGCFVYNFSIDGNVICGCKHLTTFQLSMDSFIPKVNKIGEWPWRTVTVHNLEKYPTVWITLSIILIIVILCCFKDCCSLEINRSALSFEDIVFKHVRDEKLKKDIIGKEIKCIEEYLPNPQYLGEGIQKLFTGQHAKKSLCLLQCKLYKLYLCSEHPVLSVFQRPSGTGFSTKQRLGCLFLYICCIVVGTAIFYGLKQNHIFGDITASFIISLFGTLPVFIIKEMFLKSKPKIISRTVAISNEDKENEGLLIEDDIEDDPYDEDNDDNYYKKREKRKKNRNNNMSEEYLKSMDVIKLNRMNTKIDILNTAIKETEKMNSKSKQLQLANEVRITLFNTVYPLNHKCKKCTWFILIILIIIASVVAIQYGLQFDKEYEKMENMDLDPNEQKLFDEECWQNNKRLKIESSISDKEINILKDSEISRNDVFDNYASNTNELSESLRWLISCGQSLLLSVFIWQPLTIYIITWMKLWCFSWNLRMKVNPKNCIILCTKCCCCCCCCCCCNNKTRKKGTEIQLSLNNNTRRSSSYLMIANKNRPLDTIGYFSNDKLFVELNNNNNNTQTQLTSIQEEKNNNNENVEMVTLDHNKKNVNQFGHNKHEKINSDEVGAEFLE